VRPPLAPKPAVVDISEQFAPKPTEPTKIPFEPKREAAVQAKGAASTAASRGSIVKELGDEILKQNIGAEHFAALDNNPGAAPIFWKKVGAVHAKGYVPSPETIAAIRKYVAAAKGLQEEAATEAIQPSTISIADLMKR
jgi:hypothetical protein